MRIIAVDPGSTTGYAIHDSKYHRFMSEQAPAYLALTRVKHALDHDIPQTDLVVCESFHISAQTLKKTRAGSMDAIETIGALRYICRTRGIPFETQTPAERAFATNARLKQLGWRNPTPGGHADDAARHLLVACIREELIDPSIFLEDE